MDTDEQQEESPTISTYKGKPLLVLNPSANYPISFGLSKARAILENIEAIEKFVESNGTSID